jgi:WD40 repeat protein
LSSGVLPRTAFTISGNRVGVWNADTGARISRISDATLIDHVSFRRDGLLATGGRDGKARIWNLFTGQSAGLVLHHGTQISCLACSPDGSRLLTASRDHTARLWDLRGELCSFEATISDAPYRDTLDRHPGRRAAFSPDNRRLLTAGKVPRIWDLASDRAIPLEHPSGAFHVEWSPNGRHVLTVSPDGTARLWDAASGQPLVHGLLRHDEPIRQAAFHPDGSFVATTDRDRARIWRVSTGEQVLDLRANHTSRVSFSRDGRHLLTCGDRLRVWNATTGELIRTIQPGTVGALAPDGDRVAAQCESFAVAVLDIPSGKPVTPPLRHRSFIRDVAFSPNGRWLATASLDGTARVWDAVTGHPLTPPLRLGFIVQKVFFSPNGRAVVATGTGLVRVWDAASGEPLGLPIQQAVDGVFSPNGRLLAIWMLDKLRIWEMPSGNRGATELMHWAQFLSASRLDQNGKLIGLEPAELEQLWQTLRGTAADFALPPGPVLVSPAPGAILANGPATPPPVWEFAWSHPNATEFHLYVVGPRATSPLIDARVTSSSFRFEGKGIIFDPNRLGWRWKVRARVNRAWTDWSEERTFDVAPPKVNQSVLPRK